MDEQFNQTLQNMLVKFVSTKKEVWSAYLDTCVFAHNTSCHESFKFTPFELMFGRKATLPIDVELQKASPEEVCQKFYTLDEPNTSAILSEHAQRLETAKQNILVAQLKQKENYDQKHAKPERFQINQVVLKKDFTCKKTKGGKLKERYLGPYTITKVLPHGTYELADPPDKSKTLRATGAHLKPYTAPSPPHEENVSEKELQKRNAQRSKTRLLPFHPHPKMTVLKTRSLSCPLMNTTISSFHPLPKRNVQRTISLFLMEMNSSSMRLSPFYPITEMSAHRRIPSPSCLLEMNFLTRMSPSFLYSSIPILPLPMPSLQLLHHAQLPFLATAPLACSTPRITTQSPPPKDFESEGKRAAEELHRNKRGRESHTATEHVSKKRKRNHKAVQKNIKAKELMLKRRQRQLKVVKKPEVVDVDEYQASHKSQNEKF